MGIISCLRHCCLDALRPRMTHMAYLIDSRLWWWRTAPLVVDVERRPTFFGRRRLREQVRPVTCRTRPAHRREHGAGDRSGWTGRWCCRSRCRCSTADNVDGNADVRRSYGRHLLAHLLLLQVGFSAHFRYSRSELALFTGPCSVVGTFLGHRMGLFDLRTTTFGQLKPRSDSLSTSRSATMALCRQMISWIHGGSHMH